MLAGEGDAGIGEGEGKTWEEGGADGGGIRALAGWGVCADDVEKGPCC